MCPDTVQARVLPRLVVLAVILLGTSATQRLTAQSVDVIGQPSPAHLRATEERTPRGDAAPLPLSRFTTSRGMGILEDDGQSYWPGFASDLHAPATFRVTPTATNTFVVRRVPYQFDDPGAATTLFDGARRPIVGYLDASYLFYTLPTPVTFAGKQYTTLSVSTWGAVAFGSADSAQLNYDPTVVSSMFRVPMVAVWYELFYYPTDARILVRNKPESVIITWQNLLSRHSTARSTFQVELFHDGSAMQLSYQSLAADDGLIGFSTGTETPARQDATGLGATDVPAHLRVSQASLEDYGGVLTGLRLTLAAAPPVPIPPGESYRYTLVVNGAEAIGLQISGTQNPFIVVPSPRIPAFPAAQINSWEVHQAGGTLSFRFPASSLEPYLNPSGTNTWSVKTNRFGGAGFAESTATPTLPITQTVRHSMLPPSEGASTEVNAGVFHYMPGVWDADRIRESIAAYLVSRGQNPDSFRFFPTTYDDGLKHANYAGTYPRQKSTSGVGQVPARTECDCHYGAEFSSLAESLASEAATQVALTHELAHEYALYADYRTLGGSTSGAWRDAGIPCFGGAHPNRGLASPSMFADNQSKPPTISVMGGSLTGTYQLLAPRFGLSQLDMYLMGLAAPAEVTPMTFLQNGVASQITIDQVIAANGPRIPAYSGQPRLFRLPTFVVKRNGETVSATQLQQLQTLLERWQSRFWRETGGRARTNLTLDGSCSYTLSATSETTGLSAISRSVGVFTDPSCPWNVSSDASWITVTSAPGASGDGQVAYTIAADPAGVTRTGTLTIAGQAFTVTQGRGKRQSVRH